MRTNLFKTCISSPTTVAAIILFLLCSSERQVPYKPVSATVQKESCKGYCISIERLKKFMLDSLPGKKFEGGAFRKSDIYACLQALPDDSVYILNVLINCKSSLGTDLAFTSRKATGISLLSKAAAGCTNCPPRSCCPDDVGIAVIDRSCANDYLRHK